MKVNVLTQAILWSTVFAWTSVTPAYPLDSCPESVEPYNCTAAKVFWNAPYLAQAGKEKNEPLCVIHLTGTNGMPSTSLNGQLSSYAALGMISGPFLCLFMIRKVIFLSWACPT